MYWFLSGIDVRRKRTERKALFCSFSMKDRFIVLWSDAKALEIHDIIYLKLNYNEK